MFATLFIILTVGLVLYYIVMIVLDMNKSNNAQATSTDVEETEIDISTDDGNCRPTEIRVDQISEDNILTVSQDNAPILVEEAYTMAESVAAGDLSAEMSQYSMQLLA